MSGTIILRIAQKLRKYSFSSWTLSSASTQKSLSDLSSNMCLPQFSSMLIINVKKKKRDAHVRTTSFCQLQQASYDKNQWKHSMEIKSQMELTIMCFMIYKSCPISFIRNIYDFKCIHFQRAGGLCNVPLILAERPQILNPQAPIYLELKQGMNITPSQAFEN